MIGDDRFQSKGQQARFRAVGLSHLLAVSGQNVAFVLAVAEPLVNRRGWWSRRLATVLALVVFAMATRLEPSVLRATGTALTSVVALSSGARASGVRALALAATALVLIDPFLVSSVGFRLSLAASAGILLVGPLIEERLPGAGSSTGGWWRTPLTVTLGAQAGVTPLLVSLFGPVALVSIPANLLAGWAAGLVMTWGLTAGVLAGVLGRLVGDGLAGVLQWAAVGAMWLIDTVASVALRMPSPMIGGGASLVAMLALAAAWFVGPALRPARWACLAAGGVMLAVTVPRQPTSPVDLEGGGRFWPAANKGGAGSAAQVDDGSIVSVLVVSAGADDRLVDALVERRLLSIDVVVLESGNRTMSSLTTELTDVATVGLVLAPPLHRVVGGRRVQSATDLRVGGGVLVIRPVSKERLEVATAAPP
ncbi:MAG: ComEC/Rec2 family competence protein [Acidimicrobiales bacterium]